MTFDEHVKQDALAGEEEGGEVWDVEEEEGGEYGGSSEDEDSEERPSRR
jgi:hypothetical protein